MSDTHSVLGRYAPEDSPEPLIEVRLLNFPLRLFAQARERHDELVREFALLAMSPPQSKPGQHVPTRLLELIAALGQRYAGSADRADAVQAVLGLRRDPGGVIPAVLELLEAAQEDLLRGPMSDVTDDAAHGLPPFDGFTHTRAAT